jgi:hypothetical protein
VVEPTGSGVRSTLTVDLRAKGPCRRSDGGDVETDQTALAAVTTISSPSTVHELHRLIDITSTLRRRYPPPGNLPQVRVEFSKLDNNGRGGCRWDAVRGKRTHVPGTCMAVGRDIPQDLAQYVIEAAAGYRNGFWDLVAKGATFKSTGRRRTTPGRAVIAEHRQELAGSEQLAGLHLALWKTQKAGPVTTALDRSFAQWRALRTGEQLVFDWPSAEGRVECRETSGIPAPKGVGSTR